MGARTSLPPSGRDYEVYRLVHVEQRSTREAAELVGISQTRVCQVLEKVAGFLVQVAPAEPDKGLTAKQLHVAEWVASERLGFLVREAVAAFRQTQGQQTVEREVETLTAGKVRVRTTRTSAGDVKYLVAAARLSILASKLPAGGFMTAAEDEDVEALQTEQPTEAAIAELTESSPPEEDCSAPAMKQPFQAPLDSDAAVASDALAGNCARDIELSRAPVTGQPRPVQPPSPSRKQARRAFLAAAG